MMNLLRYWPPLLHLALLAVLLSLAVWQWMIVPDAVPSRTGDPSAAVADPSAPAKASLAEETAASQDQSGVLTEIMERPLFRQGRRQIGPVPAVEPEPTERVAEPEPAPPEPMRMVGYVRNGIEPIAIIFVLNEGVEHVVRKGDEIAGMVVISIESNKVVLKDELREVTVSMSGE